MKYKDIKRLGKAEREKKMKELKMELVKSKVAGAKSTSRKREIRKIIARMHTLHSLENKNTKEQT